MSSFVNLMSHFKDADQVGTPFACSDSSSGNRQHHEPPSNDPVSATIGKGDHGILIPTLALEVQLDCGPFEHPVSGIDPLRHRRLGRIALPWDVSSLLRGFVFPVDDSTPPPAIKTDRKGGQWGHHFGVAEVSKSNAVENLRRPCQSNRILRLRTVCGPIAVG
jgi:hypothetical protein